MQQGTPKEVPIHSCPMGTKKSSYSAHQIAGWGHLRLKIVTCDCRQLWKASRQAATTPNWPPRHQSTLRMLIPWLTLLLILLTEKNLRLKNHDLSGQVVSVLQHLLRLEPGCRLVDFGAGACKLASQLHRSKFWTPKSASEKVRKKT